MVKEKSSGKKKKSPLKVPSKARVYITATFNNTILTFTDEQGNVFHWGSTGRAGFSGSRKSTPFAATTSAQKTAVEAYNMGVRDVKVYVKGPGSGRDAALRAVAAAGIRLNQIADVTAMPHNGPRPRKRRRA